jgi:hypothetical protein
MSRLAPDLARGDLTLPPLKRIVINLSGFASKARAIVTDSTTSSRRSRRHSWRQTTLVFQAKCEGLLGQPGSRARPNHQLAKGSLIGRMDSFTDTAGG